MESSTGLCTAVERVDDPINTRERGTVSCPIEKVRAYLEPFGVSDRIREFDVSSATVELAAVAVGVEPARIAKTLSFKAGRRIPYLVVTAGDAKIDNSKYKHFFGIKAKMLTPEEAGGAHRPRRGRRVPLRPAGGREGLPGPCPCGGLTRCFPPWAAPTAPLS